MIISIQGNWYYWLLMVKPMNTFTPDFISAKQVNIYSGAFYSLVCWLGHLKQRILNKMSGHCCVLASLIAIHRIKPEDALLKDACHPTQLLKKGKTFLSRNSQQPFKKCCIYLSQKQKNSVFLDPLMANIIR